MSQLFVRSEQLADQIHDIKLKIPEWKILFTIDGVMGSEAIADFLDISEDEVFQTLQKLKEMQLITEKEEQPVAEDETSEERKTPAEELLESPDFELDETDLGQEQVEQEEPGESDEKEVEEGRIELSAEEPEEEELSEEGPLSLEDESFEEQKEDEALSDQEFDKFIGGLLNEEEEKETPTLESPEPSLEVEMPLEAEAEQEESDLDFGNFFEEEAVESEQKIETEEKPELPEEEKEAPEEKAAPEIPPTEELPGKQKTILVVDDSVVIRKMVEIALENEKYNIKSVATGKEALQYLDENTPDLIILDIMLPDVNGLDVLKAVKASKQIPVVMLSAKDTPRETSKAKELGANDFIPKPFKDEELVNKVRELVSE